MYRFDWPNQKPPQNGSYDAVEDDKTERCKYCFSDSKRTGLGLPALMHCAPEGRRKNVTPPEPPLNYGVCRGDNSEGDITNGNMHKGPNV